MSSVFILDACQRPSVSFNSPRLCCFSDRLVDDDFTPIYCAMDEVFHLVGCEGKDRLAKGSGLAQLKLNLVEARGLEPLTSCMPCKRSPS